MGVIRFHVTRRDRVPTFALDAAHVTGFDRTPWQGTTRWVDDDVLEHRRSVSESGVFCCPWVLETGEWLLLATTSLREAATPYQLERELARGTVSRGRDLKSQMDLAGCAVSPEASHQLRLAQNAFVDHISSRAIDAALEAIERGSEAIRLCMADLERFQQRRRRNEDVPTTPLRVGTVGQPFANDEAERAFLDCFDTVAIPVNWRDIEREDGTYDWRTVDRWVGWATANQRRICLGPLVRLDRLWLPDWVFLLRDQPREVLHQSIEDFLRAVVLRYGDQVDLWLCASDLNVAGELSLLSEDRLRLAVTTLEAVKRSDRARKPLVMRFAQPWSESLIRNEMELPAFHFADALVRANLGLCGIGIDLDWGIWPTGTLHRDALAVHMMLQRWSALEVPLLVGFTVPASPESRGNGPTVLGGEPCRPASPATQAQELQELMRVAAAVPSVHGLAYHLFSDADRPVGPLAGFVDASGTPRPALDVWKSLVQSDDTVVAEDGAAT